MDTEKFGSLLIALGAVVLIATGLYYLLIPSTHAEWLNWFISDNFYNKHMILRWEPIAAYHTSVTFKIGLGALGVMTLGKIISASSPKKT